MGAGGAQWTQLEKDHSGHGWALQMAFSLGGTTWSASMSGCMGSWRGEILDSIQIFRQGLNGFITNAKSIEIHAPAGKAKLVQVEDYPRAANPYQEVNCVPPM